MNEPLINAGGLLGTAAAAVLFALAFAATPAGADITTEKWAKPLTLSQQSVSGYYDPGASKIAILPFSVTMKSESYGRSLMNKLIAEVSREGVLTVVTRDALDRILGEQRLQHSGFVEAGEARELGRLLGANLLAFGNLSALSGTTQSLQEDAVDYYKEVQKSKQVWNKEKGAYETKYFTEKEPVYKKVWVHEQWAGCEMEIRLVDVETGKVVFADGVKSQWTNRNYDNQGKTYAQGAMEEIVLGEAMTALARKVTPYRETHVTYLMCYAANFMGKGDAAAKYEEGWQQALEGRYSEALENFEFAYGSGTFKETRARVVLWNIIAMNAALGRFDECDGLVDEYLKKYNLFTEASEKRKARELKSFLARNFERLYGVKSAEKTGLMQIAAADGGEYFLTGAVPAGVRPGSILQVVRSAKVYNQITGEELGSRERVVGTLEVVEIAENFVIARLVDGEAKIGDFVSESLN